MNTDPDSEISDSILLARFAETSDSDAFERLYRRHRRLVFAASKAVLGNDDSANDTVGATFVLLSKHAELLSRRRSVAGWLFQTATLLAKNLRRQEQAQLRKLQRYGDTSKRGGQTRFEDELDVMSCLDALPMSSRQAVLLRFFEGMSYSEVGEALNCSEDAARQRIQRSLETVAKMFAGCGVVLTPGQIEVALHDFPDKSSGHWMSSQGAKLAESFERARRFARIRFAAFGAGAVLLALPAFNTLGTAHLRSMVRARAGSSTSVAASAVARPRGPQIPTMSRPFALIYREVARSSGVPDQKDELILAYDGSTLLTKRGPLGAEGGEAIGLMKGNQMTLFLRGSFYGSASETTKWIETVEMVMDTIDPDRDEWLHQAKPTQAPPLTRLTFVTNIPPIGVSLPEPLLGISLDGSYSWFMGDPALTRRDSKGNLIHFGAYDTTYDLSDYRRVGDMRLAGRVVVRRSQGDFGGPNEYTLKSATATPLPVHEFQPETYRKGELLGIEKSKNPFGGWNRVYVRANTPKQVRAQLMKQFGIPTP